MKKIFSIVKKMFLPILLVIILLFIQAQCDLKLPDYTSNIINIGVQQNGIEDNVPNAMRESIYNLVIKLANEEDKALIINSYKLVKPSDNEYKDLTIKNKNNINENLYVLKDISKETRKDINEKIETPLILAYFLTSEEETIASVRKQMASEMNPHADIDLAAMIMVMEQNSLDEMKKAFNERLNDFEDALLNQMKIAVVKGEYEIIGYDMQPMQTAYILKVGLQMALIALLVMVITITITLLSSVIGTRITRDLRNAVSEKVMSFSNKEFEEFSTASLITRTTSDVYQVQMLIVMGLRMLLYAPILGIGALMKVYDSPINWVIGVAVMVIFVVVVTLLSIALPKFNIMQKLTDKLNLVSREILTGLPVIRAFSNEEREEERFDEANKNLTKTNLFVNRVMTVMMPTMTFIMSATSVLIIWVGAKHVDLGTLQVGTLTAFITYTMQIIMAFLMLTMLSIILPRAIVSMKRIAEVFNKKNSIIEKDNPKEFKDNKGTIEFINVNFKYPGAQEYVLKDINIKINPGTTTAFIGSTGSGKSTVINLIPRFYDVTEGEILVDNLNIKDVSLSSLREKIGFVPQKGILFTGTIGSNIAFGEENLSDEDMKKAASIAMASEFIDKLDDGYDSYISQGGTNVSGGQKQRLAIARALAKNPEILIFDDSFSALDFKTDAALRKALKENYHDKTKIIVASRIATIMDADQIIVLDEGKISGIGTHHELLENNEVYLEIATSQLSEEELKHGRK